jgi:hypothetical protein
MEREEELRRSEEELQAVEPQALQEQTAPAHEHEQWWRNDDGSGEVQ